MTKLTLEMSDKDQEEVESLLVEGGFESYGDLLSNAIALLEWAVGHARLGHGIAAFDETAQTYTELEAPFLARIKANIANDPPSIIHDSRPTP